MKNRKALIVTAVIAVLAVIIAVFAVSQRRSAYFIVENNDDGSISVTAQKAAAESAGTGYITIAEGQQLSVRCGLTDSSSVKIEVLPRETDAAAQALMEETFSGTDSRLFELPEGEYTIRITAAKGTAGNMDISAEEQ